MEGKEVIAEISLEGDRLYLIHKRKGNVTSKTDVTQVWHFCNEVTALANTHAEGTKPHIKRNV